MKREELESKTVTELKKIAKELDIKETSKLKKDELIEQIESATELEEVSQNVQEQNNKEGAAADSGFLRRRFLRLLSFIIIPI